MLLEGGIRVNGEVRRSDGVLLSGRVRGMKMM